MNKRFQHPKLFHFFLLAWLLLNLFQAFCTELLHDEAYYWVWSRDLDWGYFDHPPLIAFFIKIGYVLFANELGARLLIVLSSTATLWLIWKIIDADNPVLFLALAVSTIIIHVGGFIAVPDIPLVFFAALFFYFLKRYLEVLPNSPLPPEGESLHTRVKDAITCVGGFPFRGKGRVGHWPYLLGLTIATIGMAYSKYQGALVILFAILPNLKLLKRPSFWLIPLVTILALIPHFHWQYLHEFPSFRYQFLDRSQVPYKIEFFFNYIFGQFLIFGPLIGFLLFPAAMKFKSRNAFDRTMQWCFYGFFGFFLIQSFRGRIEPNWTVMAIIPLLYLAYHFIKNRPNWAKWAFRLCIPSLIIIFIFRIYLMVNFLPKGWSIRNEFHNWDTWAQAIAEKAGDAPVVFQNSFQLPSKYMFYTGKPAHAINNFNYAGKQYDLMIEEEEALQGKPIYKIHLNKKFGDSIAVEGIKPYWGERFEEYYSFNRVKIKLPQESYSIPLDTILEIPATLFNPTSKTVDFTTVSKDLLKIEYCLFWYGEHKFCEPAITEFPIQKLEPGEEIPLKLKIRSPKEDGEHWRFRFSIHSNWFSGRNSDFVKMEILMDGGR